MSELTRRIACKVRWPPSPRQDCPHTQRPRLPPASICPAANAIQLAELFYPDEDHKIRLAVQIGISHAIVSVSDA